jgi:catechol-2,3-dioxygenase
MMTAPPTAFVHVVLRTASLEAMRDWYCRVLCAHVVFENGQLCFLTYDDEHHRIALLSDPDAPTDETSRLAHIAYSYQSIDDLLEVYNDLRSAAVEPYWTVNHGPTTSFYYHDPDGNGVELQVDNYPTVEELQGFFSTPEFASNPVGIDIDPDDLRTRLAGGESASSLLRRPDVTV